MIKRLFAGLLALSRGVLDPHVTGDEAARLEALLGRIPPLPRGRRTATSFPGPAPSLGGEDVYLPAQHVALGEPATNAENVELHAVYPLRLAYVGMGVEAGVGAPSNGPGNGAAPGNGAMDLAVAKRTFASRPVTDGWYYIRLQWVISFGFASPSTRTEGPHGGASCVRADACRCVNEIELTATHYIVEKRLLYRVSSTV